MRVSKHEKKKARGGDTATRSIKESKRAQWSKGTAPKGSSDVYGGVDNKMGNGDFCGV